jgi:hypothetical protein
LVTASSHSRAFRFARIEDGLDGGAIIGDRGAALAPSV